jgi:hypothetical protein
MVSKEAMKKSKKKRKRIFIYATTRHYTHNQPLAPVRETPELLSTKLSASSHVPQLPLAVLQLRPFVSSSDYPVHWVDSPRDPRFP